jgi:hypothetical protein
VSAIGLCGSCGRYINPDGTVRNDPSDKNNAVAFFRVGGKMYCEDCGTPRWKRVWTLEEIDAAHEEALVSMVSHSHPCRVCGRLLSESELVTLTHPIVLCWDCR